MERHLKMRLHRNILICMSWIWGHIKGHHSSLEVWIRHMESKLKSLIMMLGNGNPQLTILFLIKTGTAY